MYPSMLSHFTIVNDIGSGYKIVWLTHKKCVDITRKVFIESAQLNCLVNSDLGSNLGRFLQAQMVEYHSWLLGIISPVPVCRSWTVFQRDFHNQSCSANLVSHPVQSHSFTLEEQSHSCLVACPTTGWPDWAICHQIRLLFVSSLKPYAPKISISWATNS
jgi:hypothetical protein